MKLAPPAEPTAQEGDSQLVCLLGVDSLEKNGAEIDFYLHHYCICLKEESKLESESMRCLESPVMKSDKRIWCFWLQFSTFSLFLLHRNESMSLYRVLTRRPALG